MDSKQLELDAFEEEILSNIFGDNWKQSKELKLLETFKPGIAQRYIDSFESLVGPFMNENGAVNGLLLKSAVEMKSPMFAELVPNRDFRLTDISKEVIKLLRG